MSESALPLETIDVPIVLCQHADDPYRVRPNQVFKFGAAHHICDACRDAVEAERKRAVAEYLAEQSALRATIGEGA